MAGPKETQFDHIVDTVELDATNPDHVETFKRYLSDATTDATQKMLTWAASTKMLITAILCDTWSPDRMLALADLILNASSESSGDRNKFSSQYHESTFGPQSHRLTRDQVSSWRT